MGCLRPLPVSARAEGLQLRSTDLTRANAPYVIGFNQMTLLHSDKGDEQSCEDVGKLRNILPRRKNIPIRPFELLFDR